MPRYAYVLNFNDTIWTFSEDATKGTLDLAGNQVNTGTHSRGMVLDPQGRYLYVACQGETGNGYLAAYDLATADHRPSSLGSWAPTNPGAGAIAMTASGSRIYVGGTGGVTTFKVGPGGVPSQSGTTFTTSTAVLGLAVHPSGNYLYVVAAGTNTTPATLTVYGVDGSTGVPTTAGASLSVGSLPQSIRILPSGKAVYVADSQGAALHQIQLDASGAGLTDKGSVPTGGWPTGVVLDPSSKFLFTSNANGASISGFRINADGTLTSTGPDTSVQGQPDALAVDPEGVTIFTTNYNNTLSGLRVNSSDGTLTFLAKSPMGGNGHGIIIR